MFRDLELRAIAVHPDDTIALPIVGRGRPGLLRDLSITEFTVTADDTITAAVG